MDEKQLLRSLRAFPLSDDRPWWIAIDVGEVRRRYDQLRATFPAHWRHAVAIKAHPLRGTLAGLVEDGAWLEAASMGEVEVALAAGCAGNRIVFDSPVKTRAEIVRAVDLGVVLNADNLDELERVATLTQPVGNIGLRVNPELGPGTVEALSVGTKNSKFGVSLSRQSAEVERAFAQWPWLDGIHVHVGSFGYSLELLAAGARAAAGLAAAVGARRVDIGGGMPPGADPAVYCAALEREAPSLFDGSVDVITEFGRWLFWDSAVAVSRVEYVKPAADVTVATIHFGGDLLLRRIYQPELWQHPVEIRSASGELRVGPLGRVTIGGPLCFGSDVIARDVVLPIPDEGDLVVVRDVGAYTFGMWSRYCSRAFPTVIALDPDPVLMGVGQSTADIVAGWT